MAAYRSSVARQLAQAERQGRTMFVRVARAGAQNFTRRLKRERLSGSPGVNRVTGRLERSAGTKVTAEGGRVTLSAWIGGTLAPHAADLEERGLLGFRMVFDEEAAKILEAARGAARFLGRDLGRGGGA